MSRSPTKTVLCAAALQDHLSRLVLPATGRPLQPPSSSPTLAQRFKLVSGPVTLTSQQWQAAHAQSLGRGDSRHECSICLQPFKSEPQLLLSCSHVFHRQCLVSFERYAQARCCPMCRCQAYQKKKIEDGARFFEEECATRIQAAYRAYLARKQFRALRELVPPEHPALRRRWVADKLQRHTDELMCTLQRGSSNIDVLFAELDATAQKAAAIYSRLGFADTRLPRQQERPGQLSARVVGACLAAAPLSAPCSSHEGMGSAGSPSHTSTNWQGIIQAALDSSDDPECPICLAPLARPFLHSEGSSGSAGGREEPDVGSELSGAVRHCDSNRPAGMPPCSASTSGGGVAVLSCSHVFHCDCLSLFEAFQIAIEAAPRCPCCRGAYARIQLQ